MDRGHKTARCIHAAPWIIVVAVVVTACGDGANSSAGDAGGVDDAGGAGGGGVHCGAEGRSIGCTGPGGCAGGQVCQADGRYSACDCGALPTGDSGLPMTWMPVDGGDAGMAQNACDVGTPCTTDADCARGTCVREVEAVIPVAGLGDLPVNQFPGGTCSPTPLLPYGAAGACDPLAQLGAQGCGSCGVCVLTPFVQQTMAVCRRACTPSADDSGCAREGLSCSFRTGACVEGCVSDDECKVGTQDIDGDGTQDRYVYDPSSPAYCDAATYRCNTPGADGAVAGDACGATEDCEQDGACVTDDFTFFEVPFSGGYCTKRGCDTPGLECDGDGVCADGRPWSPGESLGRSCVHPCVQGAEPPTDQLGPGGHGADCRPGYMCQWRGGMGDTSGMCMPGNYNDVMTDNVGDACVTASDCFSPYGHGRCLMAATQTQTALFCTILDCDSPALPRDICGPGSVCARSGPAGVAACVRTCIDATECAPALGCLDFDGDPRTAGLCYFGCINDSECRPGETCGAAGLCGS